MEKAGVSPPIHSSASGSSPPPFVSQSRTGFMEPTAPGKVVAGAVPGGWSRATVEGRAPGPGSAGGTVAASEGNGWEAERSSGVVTGPISVGAGTVDPGVVERSGERGLSWRGKFVEVGESMGPGPAHGPQRLSWEGLAPGRTSEAVEEAPGSTGKVLGVGVTVALGAVGGKEVSPSLARGTRGRSGL